LPFPNELPLPIGSFENKLGTEGLPLPNVSFGKKLFVVGMGAGGVSNKLVGWETGLSMVVHRNKSSRSLRAAYLSEAEITLVSGCAVTDEVGAEGGLIFLVGGSVGSAEDDAGGPRGSGGMLSKAAVSKLAKLAKASGVEETAALEDAESDVEEELVVPKIDGEGSTLSALSEEGGLMTGGGPPPGRLMEMLP